MKTTPGFFGSRVAPTASGVYRRAGTFTPSRAGKVITGGLSHVRARKAPRVDIVTWRGAAPTRFGSRYTSHGVRASENTSARVASSGDSVRSWAPARVVSRVMAPPPAGRR